MKNYYYNSPASFDELFQILNENNGEICEIKYLAGGTDLVPRISLEREALPKEGKDLRLVHLGSMGLDLVTENETETRIGALCTFRELEGCETVIRNIPELLDAVKEIAGITVRNSATMGGNIMNASPAADSVPMLMALGARFVLKGPAGTREVPAEDFFTGPGRTVADSSEILAEIVIPKKSGKAAFQKLGRRKAETLSIINAAAYLEVEGNVCKEVRLSVGSAAPTVVRCKAAEQELQGSELTEEAIKAASEAVLADINPIDDIRATAWYRKKVAPVVVRKAIEDALAMK